mgnify:CR=1 FL=1
MNHVEHYHDWLRDAHAMEKQAESMLESMAGRIDNYPDLRSRIEQHVTEPSAKLRFWKRFWIVMIYRGRC